MNILIAPNAFKESLSAPAAAQAIARGLKKALPTAHYRLLPLADGGQNSAEVLAGALGGVWQSCTVHDALGKLRAASYLKIAETAVIEMAAAAGLDLIPPAARNPRITSTLGVGELIAHARHHGAQKILITLGGSATNDAGTGMLSALGWQFLDAQGVALPPGGAALKHLAHIVPPAQWTPCPIVAACDVDNPLCGPRGATAVFAAQKGADAAAQAELEAALSVLANRYPEAAQAPGAGAAGGMGFALRHFLGAQLVSGFDWIADACGLDEALAWADVVITGEGCLDGQSAAGKVPWGVLQRAGSKPVIALVGALAGDAPAGFAAVFPILPGLRPLPELLREAAHHLERSAQQLAAVLALGQR